MPCNDMPAAIIVNHEMSDSSYEIRFIADFYSKATFGCILY